MLADAHLYAAGLGLVLPDPTRLGERAVELAKTMPPEPLDDGGVQFTWRDPSRASMSVLLDDEGRVRTVLPFLDGAREVNAQIVEMLSDGTEPADDTLVVDVFRGDEWAFRTGTHAQDVHVNRPRLQNEVPMRLALTVFARKFVVRGPHDPPAVNELGNAATRWVATGLTAARQQRAGFSAARALIRAEIRDCEQRINRTTREPFQRARIVCEGVKLDVVAGYDERNPASMFRPGQVFEGSVALIATVDVEHHDYTMPLMRARVPT